MGLYIRQLLAGRDFGVRDVYASRMANFIYLIGDDDSRDCMVVDPAWDINGILGYIDREGMRLTGALATHYHPDHVGGEMFGLKVSGLAELLSVRPAKVHVNAAEAEGVAKITGVSRTDLVEHIAGDEIQVGAVKIRAIHTPGHTPGSQCFLAGSALVSGDTLFTEGCGRVDLPGSSAEQMYHSLTQVLSKLPDDTVLYPGHNYGARPHSTMGEQKRENYFMRIGSLDEWMRLMRRY
jgi:glyoxylase-like metal-dependent hydrolase (beta-lactamase superfamily II)